MNCRAMVVVLVVAAGGAERDAAPDAAPDAMLEALVAGGATRAALCAPGCACAGALWAPHWLLARASCLARAPRGPGALVLLHREPRDCRHFEDGARSPAGALRALARVLHPGFAPEDDEPAPRPRAREPDARDAALVLLASPAPRPRAGNLSSTLALLPHLGSWLRYAPEQVAWARESPPTPEPHALDPARVRALDSPLRMLLATAVLPFCLLFLAFLLLLRYPEHCARGSDHMEERLVDNSNVDLNENYP